jgi:type I restriction enzyme M protein
MTPNNFREKANFIWQVADDILRGAFKAHEYGDVILPFVVLRRLDLYKKLTEPKVNEMLKRQWFEVLAREMGS